MGEAPTASSDSPMAPSPKIVGEPVESAQSSTFEEAARQIQLEEATQTSVPKGYFTGLLLLSIFAATFGGSFQIGYYCGLTHIPRAELEWLEMTYQTVRGHTLLNDSTTLYEDVGPRHPVSVSKTRILYWEFMDGLFFSLGAVMGALLSSFLADKCGRKGGMLLVTELSILSVVFTSSAKLVGHHVTMLIGRFLAGINAGTSAVFVPIYLYEISPPNLRGMVGSMHETVLAFGAFTSTILGYPELFGTEYLWPIIYALPIIPSLTELVLLPLCPESPFYNLIFAEQPKKAERDFVKLRDTENVAMELDIVRDEAVSSEKVSIFSIFDDQLLWPVVMVMLVMLSHALFDAVILVGSRALPPREGQFLITFVHYEMPFIFLAETTSTLLPIFLVDHPKCGRRLLLTIGLWGMAFSSVIAFLTLVVGHHIGKGVGYVTVCCRLSMAIFYGIGPGPIPWFLTTELFETKARASAQAVANRMKWMFHLAFLAIFELLIQTLTIPYIFLISGLLFLSLGIFSFIYVPEPHGRTPADIYEEFKLAKSRFKRYRIYEGE